MSRLLLIILSLLFSVGLSAAEKIRSYKVIANPMRMNQIAERFEVVKKLGIGFEVYVKEEDVRSFLGFAPRAKLLASDIHAKTISNKNLFERINLSKYRKFADVERDLNTIASTYKEMASVETYGVTKEGRNLYALKISSGKTSTPKAQVMVTAATHGDELITVEVLFSLINELLAGYGKDSRLTQIIDGRDIYFIPVVSPDSFEARERYVEGQDPNRSFPWPEKKNNKTVDCIQSIMNYYNAHNFVGTLDLHAYGRLVMYPWGYTDKSPDSKDEVVFNDLANSMARENQYTAGQISKVIYVAKGSSADYYYWKKKSQSFGVELSDEKVPSYSSIPKVVDEAREMTWRFLEHFN